MPEFGYLQIAATVNLVVFLSIYFPSSIYGVTNMYKHRNEMFVQKRNKSVTISLCIFFLIFPLSTALIVAALVFVPSTSILVPLSLSSSWLSLWFLFYALICKYWIRYYCYKWTYFMSKQQWESIIVPNKKHRSQNWFLSHHADYGNFRFVTKYIGFIYLILMLICIITTFISHLYASSALLGLVVSISLMEIFAIIPIIIIVSKTYYKNSDYYFTDPFCIGWESKQQLLSLVAMAGCGAIATCVIGILGIDSISYVAVSGTVLINGLCITIMCWCSTIKIIQKNKLYAYHEISLRSDKSNSAHTSSVISNSTHHLSPHSSIKYVSLHQIFQNKAAIKLFMKHLSTEFSVELLTSYIEFNQYQKYLMNTFHIETSELIRLTVFPSDLAVCTIVSSDDSDIDGDILKAKYKAFRLFSKYIATGSEHEINISFDERETLEKFFFYNNWKSFREFVNISERDLLVLFANCKDEMVLLMKYSLCRFQFQNEDYQIMSNIFPKKK